jgi:PAS domain S-box-containing protein
VEHDGRTREELLEELRVLRARVVELQLPDADPGNQRVRELLDQIPAILWTTDLDLKLTWWRGGGIIVLGLDAEAQLGVSVYDFFGTTKREHPAVHAHRAAVEGEARDYEVRVEVEGRERWLRAHIEPLRGGGGVIRGAIGAALDITERVRSEAEREALIEQLRHSVERVKRLSGLIPICAHCKSIRDDRGYWQQVDAFVREHSDAQLSHGICPDCAKKLMPDAVEAKREAI